MRVGMKWIDGKLVTNPNAEWCIEESTRDMIWGDVNEAISEGWSNQRLSKAIQENNGFSESRSIMIARTETAFARHQRKHRSIHRSERRRHQCQVGMVDGRR